MLFLIEVVKSKGSEDNISFPSLSIVTKYHPKNSSPNFSFPTTSFSDIEFLYLTNIFSVLPLL